MNETFNHRCAICDAEYHYCDDCKKLKDAGITPWRTICDTIQCFQVFGLVKDINANRVTPVEVESQLDNIGVALDIVKTYKQSIQDVLLPMYHNAKPKRKNKNIE